MKINVLGSGYMGKQICSLFVALGHSVNLWQNTDEKLDHVLKAEIQKLNKYFDIKNNGTFSVTNDISYLEENLTIETVKEDLKVKKEIISKLKFKNNIFSNTSSLKLSEIGENINGFHFMNPITIPLVELCKKGKYSEDLLKELLDSLIKQSYEIINVTDKPGFIGDLGQLLGQNKINIASFHLGRREKSGEAIALVEIDQFIDEKVIENIKKLPQVVRVNVINFK